MKIFIQPEYNEITVQSSYDACVSGKEAPTVEAIWRHVQEQPERFGEHEEISFVVSATFLTDWEFPEYVNTESDNIEIIINKQLETLWRVDDTGDNWSDTGNDEGTLEDINAIFELLHKKNIT